jgi:hypothetical protein
MALTKTLAQLRTALLVRAGMNSTGVSVDLTSAVLDGIINDALYEGWDIITNKWLDYYTKASTTAVVAGTDAYQVPSDFYKLRTLWIQDGTRWLRMHPIDLDAAHEYTGLGAGGRSSYRYRLMSRDIVIAPVPSSAETIKLYYIAIQPELTSDSDSVTFDVPIELKFILAIAWRDILDRQNLDPSPALAKMQSYESKLRTAADSRDAGEPFYLNPRGPTSFDDDGDF